MKKMIALMVAIIMGGYQTGIIASETYQCPRIIVKQNNFQWISEGGRYNVISTPLIRSSEPMNIAKSFTTATIAGSSIKCTYKIKDYWIDTTRSFANKRFSFVPASDNWRQIGPTQYMCSGGSINACSFQTAKSGR